MHEFSGRSNKQQIGSQNRAQRTKPEMHDNSAVFAKGKTTYLKAADNINKNNYQSRQSNKSIIGTLIRGLDPRTTSAQVAIHLRREARLTVRPEKLVPKNSSGYASFFIRCNPNVRYRLMDEDLWPAGTTIKPYWD
jgi:hypothetical protein